MKLPEAEFLVFICLVLQTLDVRGYRLLDSQCAAIKTSSRVINGQNADILLNPWMAMVIERGTMICGGSLIHSRFVLTAAHCVKGQGQGLTVRLGDYDISHQNKDCTSDGCSGAPKDFTVIQASTPLVTNDFRVHDIALLKLDKTVEYDVHIRPVCLLVDVSRQMRSQLMNMVSSFNVTGWGRTQNGHVSHVLQRTTLNKYPRSQCSKYFAQTLASTNLCAINSRSFTCSGDSGGPVTAMIPMDYKRVVQFGLVSYSVANCRGPLVFPNLLKYGHWIENVINQTLEKVSKKKPIKTKRH